jgi:D-alanyl-D-alanine carboxypeptidase
MNEVAVQLGMTNTTYKTPSGLCCVPINKDKRDPKFDIAYNSYTTAYD